ncbi:copper chaperone PCu(A)C [Azospirillum agricola]|uniref:copper chaperone PCu(A)C n=1 Tax=Azospirillum agricola TaxID=1720247 RepID=UPI000A0EEF5F|nr:copper chaperone PCu(A)C [Azospirillum agricola]SMH61446.1 hypothetical protein SAMN02982994_5841 [Azospirillum lipoferum]
MTTLRSLPGLVLLGLAAASPALAEPVRSGAITVERAWARATTPGAKTGAAYLVIRNDAAQPERILSLAAPVAGHVMAHETRRQGDVLTMQEVPAPAVPAGGALRMEPGGMHVMLMELKGGLKPGQKFPLTVTFERSGAVQVPVTVGGPGAMGPE